MLQRLGLGIDDTRNRGRLNASLQLLSELSVRHKNWFHSGPRGGDNRIKLLPPAIRSVKTSDRRVTVTLSKHWFDLARSFFIRTPVPLPGDATAQNLVLFVLTAPTRSEDGVAYTSDLNRRWLCRKVGLNHRTRNDVLDHAIKIAKTWFASYGGTLTAVDYDDWIGFVIHYPKLPKPKKAEPQVSTDQPKVRDEPKRETPKPRKKVETYDEAGNIEMVWEDELVG